MGNINLFHTIFLIKSITDITIYTNKMNQYITYTLHN